MGSPFLVDKEGPTCKESERNEKYEFVQLLITSDCSLLSYSTNYVPMLFGYPAEIRLTRFAFTLHAQQHGLFTNLLNLPLVAHAFGSFGVVTANHPWQQGIVVLDFQDGALIIPLEVARSSPTEAVAEMEIITKVKKNAERPVVVLEDVEEQDVNDDQKALMVVFRNENELMGKMVLEMFKRISMPTNLNSMLRPEVSARNPTLPPL
nr:hypothetical protein HmN_000668000 [Hymenolepis microstoma]